MKNTHSILILAFTVSTLSVYAQGNDPSRITGLWRTEDGSMAVKIDKIGNNYLGRIAWLQADTTGSSPLLDKHNPEPHLQNMPLKGNKILRELTYSKTADQWEGGVYYDYETGTLYNCIAALVDPNHLHITKFLRNPNNATIEIWQRMQ